MPEPLEHPAGPPEAATAPAPPVVSVSGPVSVNPAAEPTDDTPTIITRASALVPRVEGTFAQQLRGRQLAHYELIEPIGVGGMAAVIRARDTHLDRVVALKILPPDMAADPENIRRFQQEARAAARLDHENIARAFFCGDDQGLHFIAFEFVEGENLRTILERRGPLPVAEAVHYLLQVATGLAHAAERGVVHRDIKPSNIIITPAGKAKLVDMGLARSLHPLGSDDLTQSGVTLGTFDYISPEQALEPREADVRSDIYSLGCTFYQLLTGQSPVPEGTAARKLHHHQFVEPIDPRQLNPAIPDELAAVLACMMAKDPAHRYQQPLHLVKHLHILAEQLGVEAEVPDAIRTLDVPLPHAPYLVRPALLAAAAALLLVALVVGHSLISRPNPVVPIQPLRTAVGDPNPANTVQPADFSTRLTAPDKQPEAPNASPSEYVREVRTIKELAEGLQAKAAKIHLIIIADEIDLTPGGADETGPGLVFDGGPDRELIIEWKGEGKHARIKLTYNVEFTGGGAEPGRAWAALTVKSGSVTLRNLRFETDATEANRLTMAAVRQLGGSLRLVDCEFIQYHPAAAGGRHSSLIVEGKADTELKARHCYFAREYRADDDAASTFQGGQDALSVTGSPGVTLTNCVFAPHQALLHLRAGSGANVTLSNCSALLTDGCVFRLDEGAAGKADVRHSLFSRPEDKKVVLAPTARATLVRQSGRAAGSFRFESSGHNLYHNLSSYWESNDEVVAGSWKDFQQLAQVVAPDDLPLDVSPWSQEVPLDKLKLNQPQQAFLPNVQLAALRLGKGLVGADRGPWGLIYDDLPPLVAKKTDYRVKIVDPSRKPSASETNVYQSLAQALSYAEKGDEIHIRYTGTLPIASQNLEKAAVELTIKAAKGYHPVLTLGPSTEADVSLFRLYDGEVKFEDLEFLLKARSSTTRETQAVIGMAGVGKCEFEHCVITLDADGPEASLAAVVLADPSKVMAMPSDAPPPREMPELRFRKCFVRGKGDMVAVRASRPFDLKAEQTVAALAGSFLTIDGTPTDKEEAAAAASQIELKSVTTHLTGNLLLLRANRNKDLVNTRVQSAEYCLFVAAPGADSLIHVDGDFSANRLKSLLTWDGKHNAYTGFVHLLDQQAQGEEMPSTVDQDKWISTTHETEAAFEKVQFAERPAGATPWAKLLPDQFKIRLDTGGDTNYGAEPKQLPIPYAERTTATDRP